MATDAERAAIMAEYMNQVDQDKDDEEEEFEGDYFDDDDDDNGGSDEYNDDDDDDDDEGDHDGNSNGKDDEDAKKKKENYAILQGNLTFNDEGKLVYSGTWSMKLQQQTEDDSNTATTAATTTTATSSGTSKAESKKKKKRTKFKLKSKRILKPNANLSASASTSSATNTFTLSNPLSSQDKPRSILFDGFFTTDETDKIEPYRKIKERDVELIFSKCPVGHSNGLNGHNSDKSDSNNNTTEDTKQTFLVKGKGCNDFGTFVMEGIFAPTETASSEKSEKQDEGHKGDGSGVVGSESFPLTCSKKYEFAQPVTKGTKKRRRGVNYNSEDDYDFGDEGDEGADYSELIGLHEEAGLSVEELRKRYYGNADGEGDGDGDNEKKGGNEKAGSKNGYSNSNGGNAFSVKRNKVGEDADDGDDDDGCGF
jgi:hypothetical protein